MENNNLATYPAIFNQEGSVFNVSFPDVPEAITFGNNMSEAVAMAQEALGLAIYNKMELPEASSPNKLELSEDDFVAMITLDLSAYRKKHHSKSIRKNTSIPEWLNEIAEKENINFSQLLQSAIKQHLNI